MSARHVWQWWQKLSDLMFDLSHKSFAACVCFMIIIIIIIMKRASCLTCSCIYKLVRYKHLEEAQTLRHITVVVFLVLFLFLLHKMCRCVFHTDTSNNG